jgi:hypothetical protein
MHLTLKQKCPTCMCRAIHPICNKKTSAASQFSVRFLAVVLCCLMFWGWHLEDIMTSSASKFSTWPDNSIWLICFWVYTDISFILWEDLSWGTRQQFPFDSEILVRLYSELLNICIECCRIAHLYREVLHKCKSD